MSYERYMSNQNGQSPEDYQGPERATDEGSYYYPEVMGESVVVGQDTGDPCDQSSAYYDPNYCYQLGGTPYDSGGYGGDPGNPYGAPQPGTLPVDYSFCTSLVKAVPLPPPPAHFTDPKGEQVYRAAMEGYYNFLNNLVQYYRVTAPNGDFNIPFRTRQVTATGNPYNDYYTNESHQILLFADINSPEWLNAGLDQYCPSYVGTPTGQCQDIPGYQCTMSGESIVMGEDFVLAGAAPVVRKLAARKAQAGAAPKGSVVWRKMNAGEMQAQAARYRAGGKSNAPQQKATLTSRGRQSLAARVSSSGRAAARASREVRATVRPGIPSRLMTVRR